MMEDSRTGLEQIQKNKIREGYKQTPSGVIPQDWDDVKMGDVTEAIKETAGDGEYETLSISAGVGFVNQAEKFGREKSGAQYSKYIILHRGDFSYNKGNSNLFPQGCIYRLRDREEAAVPNVFESFRLDRNLMNGDYYEQLFGSGYLNKQLYSRINHGVRDDGLLNLTEKDFYSCHLPVPPLAEQGRIAGILIQCDGAIELQRCKTEEMKELKKVCLRKMFPREGSNVPEIRFPGFTAPWEQRRFSEFTFPTGERNKNDLQLEAYAITKEHGFIPQNEAHEVFGYMKNTNRTAYNIVRPNSFAYNPARINVGSIGYYKGKENVIVSSLYEVFQTKEYVDDEFLWQWFKADGFPRWIKRLQEGSVRQYFYYDKLCECELMMPGIEEQRQIATYFSSFDHLITLHQRKLEEMRLLKKALMQLLLTGIVRVKV